jgi:hypothetical protein
VIVTFLLGLPFYVGSLLIGAGISFFLVGRFSASGRPKFLKHLYMISVVWLPVSLFATIIAFVLTLLNVGLLAILTTIGVSVYAGLLIQDGIKALYSIADVQSSRIAVGSVIVGIFIGRLILGWLLASITAASLLIFLFS